MVNIDSRLGEVIYGNPGFSVSAQIAGQTTDKIDGQALDIVAPVQTADPNNQWGERIDLLLGINLAGQTVSLKGQRIALEFGAPIYQHLNGPQLETDWIFTTGYQIAFNGLCFIGTT